jgi:CarD family transcriptional regulator
MFEIGEYVVYGNKGVCVVKDITTVDLPGAAEAKEYYILQPVEDQGATVYLPVNSQKAVIRRVITRDEAKQLMDDIPNIKELQIPDDKKREVRYKEAMKTCDCRVWVSIIKTLYTRRKVRIEMGKKVTALDEKYLRAAEHELFDELSIALDVSHEEMRAYMEENI